MPDWAFLVVCSLIFGSLVGNTIAYNKVSFLNCFAQECPDSLHTYPLALAETHTSQCTRIEYGIPTRLTRLTGPPNHVRLGSRLKNTCDNMDGENPPAASSAASSESKTTSPPSDQPAAAQAHSKLPPCDQCRRRVGTIRKVRILC